MINLPTQVPLALTLEPISGTAKTVYVQGREPGEPGQHFRRDLPPGSGHWRTDTQGGAYLEYTCPCGCGAIGVVQCNPKGGDRAWKWTGGQFKPTLTPSIARRFGCRWHGWLTEGKWITAGPSPRTP